MLIANTKYYDRIYTRKELKRIANKFPTRFVCKKDELYFLYNKLSRVELDTFLAKENFN